MTRSRPRSQPPDDLGADQWNALARWAAEREPWAVGELADLVEHCLDHHRAHGNAMADWVAACRTWVRNERRWGRRGGPSGTSGGPLGGGNGRGGVAAAARIAARRLGLFGAAS